MIFSVTIIGTGNIGACGKIDGLAGRLEKVDESIVAMVQAGSCSAAGMAGIAVGETLIVVLCVFPGVWRISMTGAAFGRNIWAFNGMTIIAPSGTWIRLRSGRRVAL